MIIYPSCARIEIRIAVERRSLRDGGRWVVSDDGAGDCHFDSGIPVVVDVPIAEVSERESVRAARKQHARRKVFFLIGD